VEGGTELVARLLAAPPGRPSSVGRLVTRVLVVLKSCVERVLMEEVVVTAIEEDTVRVVRSWLVCDVVTTVGQGCQGK
jgi:hypothetical protein